MIQHTAHMWYPLSKYGLTSDMWGVDIEILTYLFIACSCTLLIALCMRIALHYQGNTIYKLILLGGHSLYSTLEDSLGKVSVKKKYFSYIGSLFFLLLFSNLIVLLPFMEEPTQNVNVTFAFGIGVFIFLHINAIKENFSRYMHHWIKTPFGTKSYTKLFFIKELELTIRWIFNLAFSLLIFPFELLGKLSLVLSLAFRLFGNIFGGSMIAKLLHTFASLSVLTQLACLLSGINIIVLGFFGLLEGAIQALVFTVIAINNLGVLVGEPKEEKE